MLPWDLEDWLTDEGDRVVELMANDSSDSLSDVDRLIYEVWVLDTEQRNGGVAQYFANRGLAHWERLCALAKPSIPAFAEFAARVNGIIAGASSPYDAVSDSDVDLDDCYDDASTAIVGRVRELVSSGG
ncbi:MAG: hypothetical protein H6817_09715 [Phycisphaerales bacterium]|nr:hypothetical protein [Phycisphaerales bacterium]